MKISRNDIKNKLKKIVLDDCKMKLLTFYIIANLLYLIIGCYIFMTGNITENFHYLQFSRGLIIILVLNIIVFFTICIKKRYQKKYLHFFIIPIMMFRIDFCILCI